MASAYLEVNGLVRHAETIRDAEAAGAEDAPPTSPTLSMRVGYATARGGKWEATDGAAGKTSSPGPYEGWLQAHFFGAHPLAKRCASAI